MRRVFFAVFLVGACATGAAADSFEEAFSAYSRGDYAQAIKLFRLAAAQGNALAQYNLGVIYDKGEGMPQDYQEAMKWYRLAAAQGDGRAQSILANMYFTGKGVRQDLVRTHMWVICLFSFLLLADPASAEFDFDEKYHRDYNIFNPIDQYRPDNPLNPINKVNNKPANQLRCGNIKATIWEN
ncbi:MAG: hypothetical protein ACRD3W_07310, partial [Terriglobales bacterium]